MSIIDPSGSQTPIDPFTETHSIKSKKSKPKGPSQHADSIAKEQLAQSLGDQQRVSLNVKQQVQKGGNGNTHLKTQGVFSWIKGSIFGLPFALQNVVSILEDADLKLSKLSGGPEFGQILAASSPMIASDLLVSYVQQKSSIAGSVIAQVDQLPQVLQVILTKAVVNIGVRMKRDPEFSKKAITPVNLLSFLFKKISTELERQPDVNLAVENILQMIFPHGAADLPLIPGLKHLIYHIAKNQLFEYMTKFNDLRKFGVNGKDADNEFIMVESRQVARNTTEVIRKYLTADSQQVADTLFSKSSVLKNMDEASRVSGKEYLASQLTEFGQAEDPNIWGMIDVTIKTLAMRFFSTLSKNKKPEEEASAAIATQLLSKLSLFVKNHGKEIARLLKDYKKKGLSTEQMLKEKPYIEKFLPLAKGLREMMGFAVEERELPEILRSFFDMVFTQQAAQNYEKILLPLTELFDALENIDSRSKKFQKKAIPDDLLTMCMIIGQFTAKKLPEWLKGQSRNIADGIASNLPREAEDVKVWLSAWINGQIVELLSSKNCTVLNLWRFVAFTIPQVLAHVLMSLAEDESAHRDDLVFVALNKVFGDLSTFAAENGKTLKEMHEKLSKVQKDPAKEQEFIALFKPFCNKLLSEIGIGGGKSLPVPELLNQSTENQLREAGPQICARLYCDFSQLFLNAEEAADQMDKDEASVGVAKLSKVAADVVSDITPKLLYDHSDKVADSVIDSLYLDEDNSGVQSMQKNKLKKWLSSQIKILGPRLKESYPELWKLLGVGLESLLAHLLFNLTKDNKEHAEASIFGATKIFKVFLSFINEHDERIAKVFEELRSSGVKDPARHADYIKLFAPLAETLQQEMGLSDFPGLIKDAFVAVFKNAAPELIARYYRECLLPLTQFFDAVEHPKSISKKDKLEKLPGGARLAAWCEFAGKAIGEDIPKMASDPDQRKDVSSKVAVAFVKAIASPEQLNPLEERLAGNGSVEGSSGAHADVDKLYGLCNWLTNWLDVKIKAAGNRQDSQVRKIWEFLRVHLDAIVAHIMLNLIGKGSPGQDSLFIAANKLLQSYIDFIKTHGDKIEGDFRKLQAKKNIDPARDKDFIRLFEPLYAVIMESAGLKSGLNLPLPDFFVKKAEDYLKELVPELFAGLYTKFSLPQAEPDKSMQRIRSIVNPKNEPGGSVYGDAGNAIQNMCSYCSAQMINAIKNGTIENRATEGLPVPVKLGKALPALNDKRIGNLWKQLQAAVDAILLETVANRLEAAAKEGKPLASEAVNSILSTVLKSLLSYTDKEKELIEAALTIRDPIQKRRVLRQLFAARASEVFALLKAPSQGKKDDPLALPLPSMLSNAVWSQLEHAILPDFLASVYMDKAAALTKVAKDKAELQKLTGSTLRSEACDILAEFISRFLPAFTKVDHETISELIFEVATKKLEESGNPAGLTLVEFLSKNRMLIQQELCHVILDSTPLLNQLQPFTKENFKIVLMQAFSSITERINSLENPACETSQKDYLIKLSTRLMNIVKDHLQNLNRIARQHNKEVFHKLDHDLLIKEFHSLHAAVPQSALLLKSQETVKASKEMIRSLRRELESLKKWKFLVNFYKKKIASVREQIKIQEKNLRKAKQIINDERRKIFFDPFSHAMLELAGLSCADDLPFPSPMKEVLWEQIHSSLLPSVLTNIFDTILEPSSRHKMVISALEAYNDSQKSPAAKQTKNKPKDPLQKALDKACGELFLEAVQMIPHSFVKSAFKVDQIKSAVATRVGRSLRQQLSERFSLQKIVDISIASGIPSFHKGGVWKVEKEPGVWVDLKNNHIEGKVKFFPAKRGPDGKMVEIPELDFAFPLEEEEVEAAAIKKMDEEEASLQQMRTAMVSTTHQAIDDLIKAPFVAMLDVWNKAVDRVFGKYSEGVRSFFHFIGFRFIYKLLECLMTCLFYPFKKAFWFVMDRHIASRVDEVIKGLQMDIHDNLLYKMWDELARSLGAKSSEK